MCGGATPPPPAPLILTVKEVTYVIEQQYSSILHVGEREWRQMLVFPPRGDGGGGDQLVESNIL